MKLLLTALASWIGIGCSALADSSATASSDWNADFRKSVGEARDAGKDNIVIFTGLEWEPWSRKIHDEAFAEAGFRQALARDFIVTHIDLPEQPKDPEKLSELDVHRYGLARDFNLHNFPSFYLCTPEGNPYDFVGYVKGGSEPVIAAIRARRDAYAEAMEKIRGLEGPARAVAIDAWLKTLPEPLPAFHRDQMERVISSDPDDLTGLWSKYKMALLLPKARECRYTGRLAEAEALYREVISSGKPTGLSLQDAYYELIDVYFQQKDYDKLLDALDRAIEASPESPRMSVLREMTGVFTRQWIYTKYQPDRMKETGYDHAKIEVPPGEAGMVLKLIEDAKKVAPASGRNRILDEMRKELGRPGASGGGAE